jgi:DNA-binding response OmpR family regulator
MRKRVLLVESDPERLSMLAHASRWIASVDGCSDFSVARRRLLAEAPDLLITNIRLGAYNGLHLVHLAAATGLATRTIVYTDAPDPVLLREAQEAGAFVESPRKFAQALASYLRSELPARDRRDVVSVDRRIAFRGGRRANDLTVE